MATSNFLQWNPSANNQENDSAYNSDTQRANGAPSGGTTPFPSMTANKAFYQWSTMVAAFAQFMVNEGISASDANEATLTANITQAILAASRGALWCGTAVLSGGVYSMTPPNPPAAYVAGATYCFIAGSNSPDSPSANVASIGNVSLWKRVGYGLATVGANDLVAGQVYTITYDGAEFQLSATNPTVLPNGTSVVPGTTSINLNAGSPVVIASVTLTMPAAVSVRGAYKAFISWNANFYTPTSQVLGFYVNDGTNTYASATGLTLSGKGGANGFQVSTGTYAAGATVTFTLYAIATTSGCTVTAAPALGAGQNTTLCVNATDTL